MQPVKLSPETTNLQRTAHELIELTLSKKSDIDNRIALHTTLLRQFNTTIFDGNNSAWIEIRHEFIVTTEACLLTLQAISKVGQDILTTANQVLSHADKLDGLLDKLPILERQMESLLQTYASLNKKSEELSVEYLRLLDVQT